MHKLTEQRDRRNKDLIQMKWLCIGVVTSVQTQGGLTKYFPISIGWCQGSILSPYLFALVMDVLARHLQEDVPWYMFFAYDILLVDWWKENYRDQY